MYQFITSLFAADSTIFGNRFNIIWSFIKTCSTVGSLVGIQQFAIIALPVCGRHSPPDENIGPESFQPQHLTIPWVLVAASSNPTRQHPMCIMNGANGL